MAQRQDPFRHPVADEHFDFVFGHQPTWTSGDETINIDCTDGPPLSSAFMSAYHDEGCASTLIPMESFHSSTAQYTFDLFSPNHRDESWECGTIHSSNPSTPRSRAISLVGYHCDVNSAFPTSLYTAPGEDFTSYALQPEDGLFRSSSSHSSLGSELFPSSAKTYTVKRSRVSPEEMTRWGNQHADGSWTCSFEGCVSRIRFRRSCDLRKHHKRHERLFFCRQAGCPQSMEGGFATQKDRLRHEARHNPSIECEWEGCRRVFSRQDNMKDHVRRVHSRGE